MQKSMDTTSTLPDIEHDHLLTFTLPARAHGLDLFDLRADADFALRWVDDLFNKGVLQTLVEAQSCNEQALRHLFFEARNQERLAGHRPVAFGFPMLALPQGDRIMAGPLLYWPLQIEPSPNAAESWIFSHSIEQRPLLNTLIWDAVLQRSADPNSLCIQAAAVLDGDNSPSGSQLMHFILEVAASCGFDLAVENLTARPMPDEAALAQLPAGGALFWAGIIGLLPTYASSSGEAELPLPAAVEPVGHPFSALDLDPYQSTVMQQARRSRLTVATGISGTGKTYLIADILLNALSNGQKCLVISSCLPELKEAQAALGHQGFYTLPILIRDVQNDQAAVVGLLRSAMAGMALTEPFPTERYKLLVEKAQRLKQKLDTARSAALQPVFGPHSWTETVGLFLRSQRQAGKELLGQQLYNQDFSFTYQEYEVLRQGVAHSQALFPKVDTLKHPLATLHSSLFLQKEKDDARLFVRQQLGAFSERAARLHHRYISTLNGYSDKLNDLYQAYYAQLKERIFHFNGLYADMANQFGASFEQSSQANLRFMGLMSERARQILHGREQLRRAYEDLGRTASAQPVFDFDWRPEQEHKSMPVLKNRVQALETALAQWYEQLPAQIQEEVQRLSHKSVHTDLPYHTIVLELERGLDTLLDELNHVELFEQPFEHQALTLTKRLKYLEEIIEHFDNTRLYLKDFDSFHEWQRHWLSLPESGRKVVRALVKVKPPDWAAALDSWYFHQCLSLRFSPELPLGEETLPELDETLAALQPLLLQRIHSLWEARREVAARDIRRAGRKIQQMLSAGPDAVLDIKALFQEAGHLVTEFFPVVLAVPAVARTLFHTASGFDYIIVDEAQALPASTGAPLLHLGQRAVVLGDAGRQPRFGDASLLGLCQAAGCKVWPLRLIHQLKPANLLQSVHDVAIADTEQRRFHLEFHQSYGFYDEHAGINEQEAQAVINLLNRIELTPQHTMPSVGIICSTPQQRDYISHLILKIKQEGQFDIFKKHQSNRDYAREDRTYQEDTADKISQLERNGLGVFHLGETYGQHFDEVIFSVTYGPPGPRGAVSSHIRALDTETGMSQLAALMNRALLKVHILCSIDEDTLHLMAKAPAPQGTWLLANFLLFVEAYQRADEKTQRLIIERTAGMLSKRDEGTTQHAVFHEEVANLLAAYLGKDALVTGEQFGAVPLPLAVRHPDSGQLLAALRADGSFYDTPETDWRWESRIRKQLTDKGISYIPLWSALWWRDAREEARKTASSILRTANTKDKQSQLEAE